MKVLIITFFILCLQKFTFGQNQLSKIPANEIKINKEIILADGIDHTNVFTVSNNGTIAYLKQMDKGYGSKTIIISKDNLVLNEIIEGNCRVFNFTFSPNSNLFSYGLRKRDQPSVIKIINLENNRNITISDQFDCSDLDFAPDNMRFVYARKLGEGKSRIREIVIGSLNNEEKILTNNGGYWPKWSPAGNDIVYVKVEPTAIPRKWQSFLLLFDLMTNQEKRIKNSEELGSGLMKWSPSGEKIADCATANLYIIDIKNENFELIESGSMHEYITPPWSPDGNKITFSNMILRKSNYEALISDFEIMVINSDGTGLSNLTNTPAVRESNPFWISSQNLIFKRESNGKNEIVSIQLTQK